MEYKFNQKINKEDFLMFYQHHLMSIFKRPMNMILILVLFGFLVIAPIMQKEYTQLFYALGLLLFVGLLYVYLKRNGEKIYTKNTEAFNMDYTINDEGLTFSSVEGESTKLWSEFYSLYENQSYIFIFLKNRRGLMFVKNTMEPEIVTYLIEKSTKNMKPKNVLIKK